MNDNPPDFPDVDPAVMAAIVVFAGSTADWLEMDALIASQHGHDPSSNADLIAGWRFVVEAFGEQSESTD